MSARTVAVTGATGFVGRHLVRALLDRGHSVVALARDEKKAREALPKEALASGRVRVVEGDVLGEGVAERLVERADSCCHLIGIIREAGGRQTFERMHVGATRRMVEACEGRAKAAGGSFRYVQMSALGVGPEGKAAYQRTKFEGEQAVRASTLAWTIMRPSLIHGPDGEFIQMAKAWAQGRAAPWAFLPVFVRPKVGGKHAGPVPLEIESAWVAPVYVEDVCGAFCEALERPAAVGEVYHLVGTERLRMSEMLLKVRDVAPLGKRSMRVLPIPAGVAALKAKAAGLVGMGRLLPFDEGMARMAAEDSLAPLHKARAQLGFAPRAFSPALEAYAPSM